MARSRKSVQSELLAREYNLYYISIGDDLSKQNEIAPDSLQEYHAFMTKGELVPDSFVIRFFERIFVPFKRMGLVIDGFPRTEY